MGIRVLCGDFLHAADVGEPPGMGAPLRRERTVVDPAARAGGLRRGSASRAGSGKDRAPPVYCVRVAAPPSLRQAVLGGHGVRIAKFAAFWAVIFLLVGLFEELLFRGYTQFTLTRGIGFWPAALALSCAFGLIHFRNGGEQWPGLLAAAAIGFFFCLTLRRTGSLWFAVGFHAAWDWGETFFYSVPDSGMVAPGHLLSSSLRGAPWLSGGSVGPEGSVLCFAVIAIT